MVYRAITGLYLLGPCAPRTRLGASEPGCAPFNLGPTHTPGGRWAVDLGRGRVPCGPGRLVAMCMWLSGPASEGRRQRLVNDGSKDWQCVVEKQGLYTAAPRKIAKASNFCVDRWMDGRTNEGVFTKSVGRKREPTVLLLQQLLPLPATHKLRRYRWRRGRSSARPRPAKMPQQAARQMHIHGAIASSCDIMSRDAVRDRTVEQTLSEAN
jgi:hypothetical protein